MTTYLAKLYLFFPLRRYTSCAPLFFFTHFTRRINKCISLGCVNGEVAPFVGRNAFFRWSAVQDAAFYTDPANNKRKQWSEANVSEDFDLALRLLLP